MPTLAIYGLVALGLLVSGFSAGWKVEGWRWQASEKAAVEQAINDYKAEAQKQNAASAELEQKNAKAKVVYQTIYKTRDRIVTRDIYHHVCFDADGVQLVNRALAGPATDPGKSGHAVSKPDAPR